MNEIGETLHLARESSGVSIKEASKDLDIKEEISNYENGIQNINEKTYRKLKQGLVKIKELIKWKNSSKQNFERGRTRRNSNKNVQRSKRAKTE